MSKRGPNNVASFVVLSLLVLGCLIGLAVEQYSHQMPQSVESQYSTSRYARTAENDIQRFCVGLTDIEAAKCAYNIEKTERENHSAQKDLRAQRYMAIYAGAMAFFAFLTLVVTALGVHYIRKTLIQTGATNSAAVKAAEAALAANQIMRDEQRPWVTLVKDINSRVKDLGHGIEFNWHFDFYNRGRSPAFDIKTDYSVIKRSHRQNLDRACRSFAEQIRAKGRLRGVPIIFPSDKAGLVGHKDSSFLRYENAESLPTDSDPLIILLVCLSYRLGFESEEMGFEVQALEFESYSAVAMSKTKLLEHSYARYIE